MSNTQRRKRLTACLLGAMVALSGCGSTVQVTGTSTTDLGLGGLGDSSGASSLGTQGGVPQSATAGTSGGATSGAVGLPGSGSTGGTGSGSTGLGSGGTSGTTGTTGSPVTKPINIGVVYVDFSKLAASFGVAAPTSDPNAPYKHLIAYINAHGGLAGRQIKADYYSIDGAANDATAATNAACTHFTQDRKADVVLSVGLNDSHGFSECLLKYGIPQFDSGQYVEDATQTARTPNQFTPGALAHDRMAVTLLKVALQRGWLTKNDVLGVVHQVCPVDTRVFEKQIVPAMKAAGIRVVEATTNCLNGNSDIGAAAAQLQSAVLKFNQQGVTQVTMPGAPEGAAILLFSQNANQQRYYPGYLLTSNSFAYDNSNSTWPKNQLPKMKGIGFTPILDVGLNAPTTPRQAKAQAGCKRMDPTLGDAAQSSQPTVNVTFFYAICDTFRLLDVMLTASHGAVGLSSLASTYSQAASSLASARLYDGTFATGGRHDGARVAVPFSYKASGCQCMSFDGAAVSTQ